MSSTQIISEKSKRIFNAKGSLRKLLDINSKNYSKFGEIYISKIKYNKIKGWKKHKKIDSNIFLLSGRVLFVSVKKINNRFFFYEHFLSSVKNDYIFIPKNNFFAFYGLSKKEAVILNLASFPHSKNETIEKKISYFNYKWKI
jgi:dTDP-4-dehydrorhamnose 3,5-epimerase